MKCTMDKDGAITIAPEGDLEAYALRHWAETNNSGAQNLTVDIGGGATYHPTSAESPVPLT